MYMWQSLLTSAGGACWWSVRTLSAYFNECFVLSSSSWRSVKKILIERRRRGLGHFHEDYDLLNMFENFDLKLLFWNELFPYFLKFLPNHCQVCPRLAKISRRKFCSSIHRQFLSWQNFYSTPSGIFIIYITKSIIFYSADMIVCKRRDNRKGVSDKNIRKHWDSPWRRFRLCCLRVKGSQEGRSRTTPFSCHPRRSHCRWRIMREKFYFRLGCSMRSMTTRLGGNTPSF